MLITYKNHPVLEKIKTGKMGAIAYSPVDEYEIRKHGNTFQKFFNAEVSFYQKKIQIVSNPFADAMMLAFPKMLQSELIKKVETQSGTLLMGKAAFCYNIINSGGPDFCVNLIVFEGNALMAFISFSARSGEWTWATEKYKILFKGEVFSRLCQLLLVYVNFLKYAPVEIKHIGANKKVKDFHGKYCNQTDLPIEIMDSTWFTTLVKSEGFKVRGHFRLQNVGPELSQKRLVWVTEHEKQGYVRNFKRPINIDE